MRRACWSLLATATLIIGGCEAQKACTPGATQSCYCSGGAVGVQVCDGAGQKWGACGGCVTMDAGVDRQLLFADGSTDQPRPDLKTDQRPPDSCQPQCAGRSCGSDGCGGTCAPGCKGAGTICESGSCVASVLSFDCASIPPPGIPGSPNLPTKWSYDTSKGHSVDCTVTGTTLRIKATDGNSSFQIEAPAFSAATCAQHYVANFSQVLLKPNTNDNWGFLPPFRPNGEGKYLLNFDLDCKVTDTVLSGTLFFQVLYHFNQDGPYITLSNGKVKCQLK
jgi:hypothetical protein